MYSENTMNSTPNSNRITISIYGKRNAGKSSLLNALAEQEISIVSNVAGTTTDPVKKAMELIPIGPVLFIDTAGIDDEGELGALRMKKSIETARRTDIALYVMDITDIDEDSLNSMVHNFNKYSIPYILVMNKIDEVSEEYLNKVKDKYKNAIFTSSTKKINVNMLKDELVRRIQSVEEDQPIIGNLLPYNGDAVLVVPIDKEAPKGRLILPQVQVIRDLLDYGIKTHVVRNTELESTIKELKNIDLVITDSQAFKEVAEIVPREIKLTSFSILFARQKGDLEEFIKGVNAISGLPDNANILIAENCTHNTFHDDIGRVKIPKLLTKVTKKNFKYTYKTGYNFTEELKEYSLVIHCGGCMVNRKEIQSRIKICRDNNIPITNYGILLAYLNGILDRSVEIFDLK